MSQRIFIKPIYEAEEFKYITYNFSRVEIVTFNRMEKKIYVFTKLTHTEDFKNHIKSYLKNSTNANSFKASVSVYFSTCILKIITNINSLSYISHYPIEDFINHCNLFIFQAKSFKDFTDLKYKLRNLQIVFPFFFILEPTNLEMEFVLSQIFKVKEFKHMDHDLGIESVDLFYDLKSIPELDEIFLPTEVFRCLVENGNIQNYMCDSNPKLVLNFFSYIPQIQISYSTKDGTNTFKNSNEVHLVVVSVFFVETVFSFVFIKQQEYINLKTTINTTNNKMLIYEFTDEISLIKMFFEMYADGKLFKFINSTTDQVHWLINNNIQSFFYLLLDRAFYLNIAHLFLPSIYIEDKLLYFNKYCIFTELQIRECHVNPVRYTNHTLCEYLHDLTTFKRCKNNYDITDNQLTITMKKEDEKFYTFESVRKYSMFRVNDDIDLQTPYYLIHVAVMDSIESFKTFSPKPLLQLSSTLRISVSNLCSATNSLRNSLFLFYKFLKNDYFLLTSISSDVNRIYTNSVLSNPQNRFFQQYQQQIGGLNLARVGIYNKNDDNNQNIVHLDFRSFYPSIAAAFNISFNNVQIIKGSDLIQFSQTKCNVFYEFLKSNSFLFTFEIGGFSPPPNVTDLDREAFYVIIYKDVDNLFNLNVYTVGKLCRDYLDALGLNHLNKVFINSMFGYFGQSKYMYASSVLYNVITYLGRRIVSFVANNVDAILSDDHEQRANLNFEKNVSNNISSRRVIYIDTDGLFILATKDEGYFICEWINQYFEKYTSNNYINLKYMYRAQFMIVCRKKLYFAIKIENNSVIGPKNISEAESELIKDIQKNEIPINMNRFAVKTNNILSVLTTYYRSKVNTIVCDKSVTPNVVTLKGLIQREGFNEKNAVDFFRIIGNRDITLLMEEEIGENLYSLIKLFLDKNIETM